MSETEKQLAHNKRLLQLKGIEEPPTKPERSSPNILELYQEERERKKAVASLVFDDLHLTWNPDGTLSSMTVFKNGLVVYVLDFVWNSDGTLNQIIRS